MISTGGTIEKSYDEEEGELGNRETIIKNRLLSKLRLPYTHIGVKSIMAKDSLHMDEQDRKIIFNAIERFSEYMRPIVVLHGTDTMEITAKFCFDQMKIPKVPVIFTGAMKPMGFEDSDAPQNVVESLFAAKVLDPGWYVVFHNELFYVPNVRKNKQKRTFEHH